MDPADLPNDALQVVKDYLSTLDAAFGAASEVVPNFIPPSDPAAQWTGPHRGPAFFAYATNYLIDTTTPLSSMSRRRAPFVRPRWMLLAHLKRILKLGRLRLRGPYRASDEFLLATTDQNLRKLAKLGLTHQPTPTLA